MREIETNNIKMLHQDLAHYQTMFSKYTSYCMHLKNNREDFSQYKKLAFKYLDLHTTTLRKLKSLQYLWSIQVKLGTPFFFNLSYVSSRTRCFFIRAKARRFAETKGETPFGNPQRNKCALTTIINQCALVCIGVPSSQFAMVCTTIINYYHREAMWIVV